MFFVFEEGVEEGGRKVKWPLPSFYYYSLQLLTVEVGKHRDERRKVEGRDFSKQIANAKNQKCNPYMANY